MLDVAPIPDLHGDHSALLQHCINMLREWGPRQPRCSNDFPIFGPELERCAMAVDVALPERMVSGPAKLLALWINHHGLYTVSELRRINIGRRELQLTDGRRLFSCFLDFGLQPTMFVKRSENPNVPRLYQLSIWSHPSHQRSQPKPKPEPPRQLRALETRSRTCRLRLRVVISTRPPPPPRRPKRPRVSLS